MVFHISVYLLYLPLPDSRSDLVAIVSPEWLNRIEHRCPLSAVHLLEMFMASNDHDQNITSMCESSPEAWGKVMGG